MSRGLIRKPSFWKIVGAYRSQWKRSLKRMFIPRYGKRGMGWWRDPKKAWYNWWYHRTSISLYRIFGCKASHGTMLFAMVIASFANIFAAPVDIAKAGTKAHKIKKARKARAQRNSAQSTQSTRSKTSQTKAGTNTSRGTSSASSSTNQPKAETKTSSASSFASSNAKTSASTSTHRESTVKSTTASTNTAKKATEAHQSTVPVKQAAPTAEEKKEAVYSEAFIKAMSRNHSVPSAKQEKAEASKEPDENTPKSKPKHERDQYIRKRMIIAGSSYCDASVLEKLSVGTYFELVAEPNNPNDKDAIALVYNGEKIGYIAKQDKTAFVSCLRLGRKVYGVITNIITDAFPAKYEFETWFDSEGK